MAALASRRSTKASPSRRSARQVPAQLLQELSADQWVSYPRAEQILERIEELLTIPVRVRMPNILVHGPSGAGKSMILEKFRRDHPSSLNPNFRGARLVTVQMPAFPSLKSFYSELLRNLECATIAGGRLAELENTALQRLERLQPRIIFIDEIHHLLACAPREQRTALNVLKFLSNQFHLSIVAAGTSDALYVMRTDPQIANRFESWPLKPWGLSEDLRRFITGFFEPLGIDADGIVSSAVPLEYLLELTAGITGRIVELMRLAAHCAIAQSDAKLTLDHLQNAGRQFASDLSTASP